MDILKFLEAEKGYNIFDSIKNFNYRDAAVSFKTDCLILMDVNLDLLPKELPSYVQIVEVSSHAFPYKP